MLMNTVFHVYFYAYIYDISNCRVVVIEAYVIMSDVDFGYMHM